MRTQNLILIVFFCVTTSVCYSQQSVREVKVAHPLDTLKEKRKSTTLIDSLKNQETREKMIVGASDSLKQKFCNHFLGVSGTPDSLASNIFDPLQKIVSYPDSIPAEAQRYIQSRTHSLEQKLNQPMEKINGGLSKFKKSVDEKMSELSGAIEKRDEQPNSKISEGINKATEGSVLVPIDVPDTDIHMSTVNTSIPEIDIGNSNLPVPNSEGLDIPSDKLGFSEKREINALNPDQLKRKITESIPETKMLDDIKGKKGEINNKVGEIQKYGKELKDLKQPDSASIGEASKNAEERLMKTERMKDISKQTNEVTQKQAEYQAMINRYSDKKLMQDELTRKAKGVVTDKINQQSSEVKEVMKVMNKRQKLKSVIAVDNKGLRGKPLGQRLIPGITVQYFQREVFLMDFGLQVGYRLTGRLRAGFGGIYRAGFDKSYPLFVKSQNVYGGRGYAEFVIRKGIYLHSEYELLNAILSSNGSLAEQRRYSTALNAGIGKQFNISRKVKGHTMVLYRVDLKENIFDQSKLNVRVGFDLRTDKKKRKIY